jgi:hypothetical protein
MLNAAQLRCLFWVSTVYSLVIIIGYTLLARFALNISLGITMTQQTLNNNSPKSQVCNGFG